MIKYDKMVRDKIPEIIMRDNKTPSIRIAEKKEILPYLVKKLFEEVKEISENPCCEELVDLETVLRAIKEHMGICDEEFETAYRLKIDRCGGFKKGIILESVEKNEQ